MSFINQLFRRVIFIFFCMGFLHCGLLAQGDSPEPADSLLSVGDTARAFATLDSISSSLRYVDQARAMVYAKRALGLARGQKDLANETRCLLRISEIHFIVSDFPPSLEFALLAEQKALEGNLTDELGNVYNSIGNIFFMQAESERALENWEKSLAYRRKYSPKGAVAGSLNNIAKELTKQKRFSQAEAYLKEAREINQEINNWRWEIFNLMNFHELELMQDHLKAARDYAEEGLELSQEHNYKDGELFFQIYLAQLEEKEGRKDAALKRFREILVLPPRPGSIEGYTEALHDAAQLAREKGAYQEAMAFQDKYIRLHDSLHQDEIQGELANIEVVNAILAHDREVEFQRKKEEQAKEEELKRARLMSFIYLLSIVALLLGAGGLLYSYLQKRKSNSQLTQLVQERTRHLQASNEQLNTFIYKSSHDLYGPVKSMQGLLQLVRQDPSGSDEAISLMGQKVTQLETELRNLIQTMELRNGQVNPQPLALRAEVDAVIDMVQGTNGASEVSFHNDIPSELGLVSDQWTLRVALRNLLENAVHFRSPERDAVCKVAVEQLPDGLQFVVTDNGSGVPEQAREKVFEMFFKASPISPGSGLGLYNARLAAEKLGGKISAQKAEVGARFTLLIPPDA